MLVWKPQFQGLLPDNDTVWQWQWYLVGPVPGICRTPLTHGFGLCTPSALPSILTSALQADGHLISFFCVAGPAFVRRCSWRALALSQFSLTGISLSKSTACLVSFCHLLLRGHKLTYLLFGFQSYDYKLKVAQQQLNQWARISRQT